jgi:hypothetical protein
MAESKARGRTSDRAATLAGGEAPAARTPVAKRATPRKTAKKAAPAKGAPAAKQPAARRQKWGRCPAGRSALPPGGPITIPKPSIAVATLSCPGGNCAEPRAEFTISGTLAAVLVSRSSLTVTCDGLGYPAAVAADGSSFTAHLRAYWAGSLSVTAVATEIAGVLARPVKQVAEPPTQAASALAATPINELRTPIEVLPSHIGQQHMPGPAEKTAYLRPAYESLLAGLGASYTQLSLARTAAYADRSTLARQLGIVLSGPSPDTARPDQLDALALDGANLTEAALEQLFRLTSTQNPDPLASPTRHDPGGRAGSHSRDVGEVFPVRGEP